MTKLARGLALVVAMLTVSAAALSVADAQDKSGKKKAGKTTGIVEVNEGKDGKFRLVIRDNDEKFLATSAAFATHDEAVKGVDRLREALENPRITTKKGEKGEKGKEKDK